MEMIGEVKNFFDSPDLIREIAMHQDYKKCIFGNSAIYSGLRSPINENSLVYHELKTKMQSIIKKSFIRFSCDFHINPMNSCLGYPHTDFIEQKDNQMHIAGVVYLNKVFPKDTGTTLFYPHNGYDSVEYRSKMEIVYSLDIPSTNVFKNKFAEECLILKKETLKEMKKFEFEYNKLVFYDGSILHSPDFYFGDNASNSRLTVVFHSRISI
jgi:hypothetical protein